MACPVFKVAGLVGKKWTIVVVQEVALSGDKGFNAIKRRMRKISPKLLSRRLRELEAEGIIEKSVAGYGANARTSYRLTMKGEELQKIISLLKEWHSANTGKACPERECVKCELY